MLALLPAQPDRNARLKDEILPNFVIERDIYGVGKLTRPDLKSASQTSCAVINCRLGNPAWFAGKGAQTEPLLHGTGDIWITVEFKLPGFHFAADDGKSHPNCRHAFQ
jgi:hypothetical protein